MYPFVMWKRITNGTGKEFLIPVAPTPFQTIKHNRRETEVMAENQRDLRTQGQKDTLKGKLNRIAGKLQRKTGGATGNRKMEARGGAREIGGNVQEQGGKVEQQIDRKTNPDTNV